MLTASMTLGGCATAVPIDADAGSTEDDLKGNVPVVQPPGAGGQPAGGSPGFGGQPMGGDPGFGGQPGGMPGFGGDPMGGTPGFGGDPGMGGAPMGMGGVPDGPCEPGDYLGLCAICGPAGMAEVAESDARCPDVMCAAEAVYALRQEGEEEICERRAITLAAGDGNCAALGECRDPMDPSVCVPGEPEEVARVLGPCQTIDGCIEGTGPTIENAAVGTPCEGMGTCQADGTCQQPPECSVFTALTCNPGRNGSTCVCGEGNAEGGTPYCEILVREGNRTRCEEFCAARGSFCVGAWNERDDTCQHDERLNCNHDRLEDYVCRCAAL
ncbi:MAG: hypothetical protein ACE366_09050 [Bradymonadia bacterium]